MNVDGYVLEIIKQIEEKGYEAYLAGTTVFMYVLGRPIKEYDVITSAPLFSFGKKEKRVGNTIHILDYEKPIHILCFQNKEEYYKSCSFNIDTLLYHHRHGIIDQKQVLNDIDKKEIKVNNINAFKKNKIDLFRVIFYTACYDFKLDKQLEEYISKNKFDFTSHEKKEIGKHLTKLFTLSTPGKTILKYRNFFSNLFMVSEQIMKILDYTKNDLSLRLYVLWRTSDIVLAEKFLREYGFSKEVKSRVLHILEFQDVNDSKLKEEEIRILFSFKRASCLASNQILKIKEIDNEERCFLASINGLYKENE